MRRVVLSLSAGALVLSAAALASSDAWKDKPYQSWDQKDVQQVLSDSPWGRQETVSTSSTSGGAEGSPKMTSTGPKMTSTSSAGGGGGANSSGGVITLKPGEDVPDTPTGGAHGSGAAPGSDTGDTPRPSGPSQIYIARWASSRTIREAMVRLNELSGHPIPDAAQKIAQGPDTYQLLILSANLYDFQQAGEAALKDSIYLETKKTHEKIAPEKITLAAYGPNDPRVRAILIDFPKKNASGEATIASDEKGVDLVAVAGKTKLKFHFEPNKMTDKQGADL